MMDVSCGLLTFLLKGVDKMARREERSVLLLQETIFAMLVEITERAGPPSSNRVIVGGGGATVYA